MLIDSTVKPISRRLVSAASIGFIPVLEVARDVFDHHDRIVHHEPRRNGQRHQRQIVQRVSQQIHRAESGDDARPAPHARE